jgi:hypothetical protein
MNLADLPVTVRAGDKLYELVALRVLTRDADGRPAGCVVVPRAEAEAVARDPDEVVISAYVARGVMRAKP